MEDNECRFDGASAMPGHDIQPMNVRENRALLCGDFGWSTLALDLNFNTDVFVRVFRLIS